MIKTFDIKLLTSPLHLKFMDYIVSLVLNRNPTALNVKPQHDLFSQKVTELKNLYKSAQAHPLSVKILEADALRDKYLTGITQAVEANTFHFLEPNRTLAILLKKNIKRYGKKNTKNDFQTLTAKIEGIVNDWHTVADLIIAMGVLELGDWVDKLDEANEEFKRLYALRTDGYSQKIAENMKIKRIEVNAAYEHLCNFLESYSVVDSSNPAYEVVIAGINSYVDQYVTLIRQRNSHEPEDPTQN